LAPLYALSGLDGAGKSTQIGLLTDRLRDAGRPPYYLWTRGGYTGPFNTAKGLARRLLGKRAVPSGRTEARTQAFARPGVAQIWLVLAMLDLVLVYGLYVRWLRLTGRTVIADRYLWDTWVDFRLNFPGVEFDRWPLWRLLVWVTPKPDHAFLLLIPVEESLRRSKLKNEPFPDSAEVLGQRLAHYERIGREQGVQMIDCTRPVDEIAAELWGAVRGERAV